jgi:hypothetical protein
LATPAAAAASMKVRCSVTRSGFSWAETMRVIQADSLEIPSGVSA